MNRMPGLVYSLSLGAFLCIVATSVSAHNPPPKQNNLALIGKGETLQVAILANCNGPQDEDDDSIVPLEERSISFNLVVVGREANTGIYVGEYIDAIELLNGASVTLDLPAATYGDLLELSIEDVSGQGVCRLRSASRIKDSNGNTVAKGEEFIYPYYTVRGGWQTG